LAKVPAITVAGSAGAWRGKVFQGLERQTDLPSPVFAPETEPSFTIFLTFFLGTTIFSETEELWKRCLRNPLKSFFVAQDTRRNAFFKMIPGERWDNSSVSWMLALAH
jgi:hypothetical protein